MTEAKKIAVLIPAYKAEYLQELLFCLRQQTYKNFRIIVSDDSPDQRVTERLKTKDLQVLASGMEMEIIRGPRQSSHTNMMHLLKAWDNSTELVHFLFDDDIIYPLFYEYHAGVHQSPEVACSVSRRWTGTPSGLPIGILPAPAFVEQNGARALFLDTAMAFKSTIPMCHNWLGEHSFTVLKKEHAWQIAEPEIDGISYRGLGDLGIVLKLLLTHKAAFITDHLGFFRVSATQNTANLQSAANKAGHLAWCALAVAARRLKKISAEEAIKALRTVEERMAKHYAADAEMQEFLSLFAAHREFTDALEQEFCARWQGFLRKHEPL